MQRTSTKQIGRSAYDTTMDCRELSTAIARFKVLHRRRYERTFGEHAQVVNSVSRIATKLIVLSRLRQHTVDLEHQIAVVEDEIAYLVGENKADIVHARELMAGADSD